MSAEVPAAPPASSPQARRWLPLISDLLGALVACAALVRLVGSVLAGMGRPCDFTAYYLAGRAYQLGLDYYQRTTLETLSVQVGVQGDLGPFLYPPLFAAAFAPFAALPYPLARVLWLVLGLLALGTALLLLKSALKLELGPGRRGIGVAFVLLFPPVFDDLLKGQITTLLFLALAGTWLSLVRGRGTTAGALVALAAAAKLAPALFLLYFGLRRQFRALAAGVVAGSALAAASLLLAGLDRHVEYVTQTLPFAGLQVGAMANVSLPGLFARLFGPASLAPALWPNPVAGALAGPLALLVIAFVIWRTVRAESDLADARFPGIAVTAIAMVLAMPSAQAYTLTLALLPLAWVLSVALSTRPPLWRLLDFAVVAAMLLSVPPDLRLAPEIATSLGIDPSPAGIAEFAISAIPTVSLLVLGAGVLGSLAHSKPTSHLAT